MTHTFKAERVTLSVPADSTDIENVPWGQKATYNEHPEDGLSMAYMGEAGTGDPGVHGHPGGTSDLPPFSSSASAASPSSRPGLPSRHSFTSFEERCRFPETLSQRPGMPSRSKTYNQSEDPQRVGVSNIALNQMALEQLAAAGEEDMPTLEADFHPGVQTAKARVFPTLQALDYEADPLTSHDSIMGTLKRGKVLTLTRTYPYLDPRKPDQSTVPKDAPREETSKDTSNLNRSGSSRKSSPKTPIDRESKGQGRLKARFDEELRRPPSPKYEEYEQAPQSPWSQSPAPSPAVRPEPKENPFFTDAFVDESSFSPDPGPEADYSSIPVPEAIGVDNSSSVLHIPLNHVLLSHIRHLSTNPVAPGFKHHFQDAYQDPEMAGAKIWGDSLHSTEGKLRTTPVAILSILCPVIPYPANLRSSLDQLSMHLATTFALCRHHTTLETELAGLKRRKPHTPGFGALTSDGRPVANQPGAAHPHYEDLATQSSFAGSMTSLSEYSGGFSRSVVCSPNPTPSFGEQGHFGFLSERMDRQNLATSPLPASEDGYFSAVHRPHTPGADLVRRGKSLREGRPSEKRRPRGSSVSSSKQPDMLEIKYTSHQRRTTEDSGNIPTIRDPSLHRDGNATPASDVANDADADTPGIPLQADSTLKTESIQARTPLRHRHTMLHTYGADFSTTFPSLPPSSTLSPRPNLPPRSGTGMAGPSSVTDMRPPSDKLKGLILDSPQLTSLLRSRRPGR
ncbi:hypothetical protein IMZ48_49620 [Candidatus Bathyarchaeota archaeon]|nr:hypothetical protein [Candidatus Bathyarchaeota archaeon]